MYNNDADDLYRTAITDGQNRNVQRELSLIKQQIESLQEENQQIVEQINNIGQILKSYIMVR